MSAAASLTRVRAISRKEFKHLFRDPRVLAVVLLLPVVELLLFAYAISFDVKNVPTVTVDQDRTPASRAYLQTYRASDFFQVKGEIANLDAVDQVFERTQARVVVVVPPGFERALTSGGQAQVAVLIDGSEPNSARVGQAYATALNQAYGRQIAASWADRQGANLSGSAMIEPRVRTWYNPDRTSSIFLIPGLMVVIIMIVTVQQTAVSLVRERDLHTQEQMLVSPLRRGELMLGKLLPWTLLAFFDMAVIAGLGLTVFGVPLRGNVPLLMVASALFIFAGLGLGLVVSAITPSMETANVVALLMSFFPAFLLSGFAFPLDSVPVALQWLSYLFPARYMVEISQGVFLKGAGLAETWPNLVALTGYAIVVVVIASVLHGRMARR